MRINMYILWSYIDVAYMSLIGMHIIIRLFILTEIYLSYLRE